MCHLMKIATTRTTVFQQLWHPPDPKVILLFPSERELGPVPAQVREAQPLQAEAAAEEKAEEGGLHALPAGAARDPIQ